MRTGLLLTLFVVVGALWCRAQDIAPGEQAKGYLESKNVTVDYATGTFMYQIPLFELSSGNFTLPVTLNYAANGVKYNDQSGPLGYNWSLQSGGVVTRMIRGGIADETYDKGYSSQNYPVSVNSEKINKHEKDGEADIFTAVFNGRTIHFILKDFMVCPLEYTNVKIDFTYKWREITGWTITDENGVKYIYRQIERTEDVYSEEAVSLNDVRHASYISSWHLSEIDVPNEGKITYEYETSSGEVVLDSTFYDNSEAIKYQYGQPMRELKIDFNRCKKDFNDFIDLAKQAAQGDYLKKQIEDQTARYEAALSAMILPANQVLEERYRIMGVLTEFKKVSGASYELYRCLNDLINFYGPNSLVAHYLKGAKASLDQVWTIENNSEKYASSGVTYVVVSPILKSICWKDKMLRFTYKKERWDCSKLTGIDLLNADRYGKRSVSFIRDNHNLLKEVNIQEHYVPLEKYVFTYYYEDLAAKGYDMFGYYNGQAWKSDSLLKNDMSISREYMKKYALQKIKTSFGGEVEINYERNAPAYYSIFRVGGFHLKSLILKSETSCDSINYSYPKGSICVYDSIFNEDILQYGTFEDVVIRSGVRYSGSACVKTGNNGIYFPYVEENYVGKGTCSYLFFVPKPPKMKDNNFMESAYLYWLCGLPLAKAIYDLQGNLIQMEKMKYLTNFSLQAYPDGEKWFNYISGRAPMVSYHVKAWSYYMNADKLGDYYNSQPPIFLSESSSYSPSLFYEENIKPRTVALNAVNEPYCIFYYTDVLLRNQQVYRFKDKISSAPSEEHFTMDFSPDSYLLQETEYKYDNYPDSRNPLRIIHHQANGDETVVVSRTPLDFHTGIDSTIDRMRESHIVAPVIKKQNLQRKAGETDYRLISEQINTYKKLTDTSGGLVFVPSELYQLQRPARQIITVTGKDSSLFTHLRENYRMESQTDYKLHNDLYVAGKMCTREDSAILLYENDRPYAVLKAYQISENKLRIFDNHQENIIKDYAGQTASFEKYYRDLQNYLTADREVGLKGETSQELLQYFISKEYRFFLNYIRALVNLSDFSQVDSMNKYMMDCRVDEHPIHSTIMHYATIADFKDFIPSNVFNAAISALSYFSRVQSDAYEACCKVARGEVIQPNPTNSISLPVDSLHKKLHIALLLSPDASILPVYYLVRAGEQEINQSVQFTNLQPNQYQLVCFDVDLNKYTDVRSFLLKIPVTGKVRTAVIIPFGVRYEVKSYDRFGRVFCKFDQTGQAEQYEYDGLDRITKVHDRDGNLLQENHYHLPTNQLSL